MDIEFFKNRSLDDPFDFESEDEAEDNAYNYINELPFLNINSPVIIESPFISDNCLVCLSAKPDILNIPCLHLSICHKCEETGKLLRCLICRKKIERKVKI